MPQAAKVPRLTGLIHRAVPYPLILCALSSNGAVLSLAHKRLSQAEIGKWVLEDELHDSPAIDPSNPSAVAARFLESLAIHKQNASDLRQLYQAWIDRMIALHASEVTGFYRNVADTMQTAVVKDALDQRGKLLMEMQSLRKLAQKERQLNRRADLNLKIKALESELNQLTSQL